MTKPQLTVAIIPARGGSKRIPNKNIRPFAGRPMITYAIQAARETGLFDRIIVSTDSDTVASHAIAAGAEAPFRRPPELSDDQAATAPVLLHALEWLESAGSPAVRACCIYATAPFVRPEDIKRGLAVLTENKASVAFTVTTFAFPILRALKVTAAGTLAPMWAEHIRARSQDLPESYHDAGQFYWFDVARFLADPELYSADARPILLPRYLVQDIDTLEDWANAEYMYRALHLRTSDSK